MRMETNHLPVRTDTFTQAALPPSPASHLASKEIMAAFPSQPIRGRIDGWTPERQRLFCEILADCGLVKEAAEAVGMTRNSAYCLRRRPEGRAFALGWDAALVIARRGLIDLAIERAVEGNSETITKDGVVIAERKKQDVRHLLTAITKLTSIQRDEQLAKEISVDFDEFLDCLESDANLSLALPSGGIEDQQKSNRGSAIYGFLECREPSDPRQRREHTNMLRRFRKLP
jgi:hypothetical protein